MITKTHYHILEEFSRAYDTSLTGSELARLHGLNQKTVSTALIKLEESGLLKSSTQGKNRLYSLNFMNPELVIKYLSSIENMKAVEFYNNHPVIKEISYKLSTTGIVLIFGSYAKGTEKPDSDLDLFVAGTFDKTTVRNTSDIYRIEINVKNYPLDVFKKALGKKDPLLEEIIRNHIIIHGSEEFTENLVYFRYGKNNLVP